MSGTDPAAEIEATPRSWDELARGATRVGEVSAEPELLRELLSFDLGGAPYAIPVERVREIVRSRVITPMPRVPDEVLGVIALRGEVVQVVDLRMRLGIDQCPASRHTRVIVLHGDDERVTGVLVDRVRRVIRVEEASVSPSNATERDCVTELCVQGDAFISILDVDRVLDVDVQR